MGEKDENKVLTELLEKHKDGSYISNLNIMVGDNSHDKLVQEIKELGTKVLFVTGSGAMRKHGILRKYQELFEKHGLNVEHYDEVSSNPTLAMMEDGLEVTRRFEPDVIFALGGGSVIDTAKIISAGMFGNIWDFVEKKATIERAIPIVASATTSGTGSHVTPYAVVTNTATNEKKTLKSNFLIPKISIVDFDCVRHMPRSVVASTGFDVLCHAAEVYTRNDCTDMAADFARNSLRLVGRHLVGSYHGDEGYFKQNKMGMVYADIYAGIALALIGTHVPHAISHPISARDPNINHGQALAYIFAETSRVQIEKGDEGLRAKFEEISEILGDGPDFVRAVNNYLQLLGLDRLPRIKRGERDIIYKDTVGYRQGSVDKSPAPLEPKDINDILVESLRY